jgi:hypothetical protein
MDDLWDIVEILNCLLIPYVLCYRPALELQLLAVTVGWSSLMYRRPWINHVVCLAWMLYEAQMWLRGL